MARLIAIVLGAALLAGCSSGISMQHPDGRRVECEVPPPTQCIFCATTVMNHCVADYKEQGFVRVPQ